MPDFHDVYFCFERGCHIIPLQERGKKPVGAWKEYLQRRMMLGELRTIWGNRQGPQYNFGIITGPSRLVVVDADSAEAARDLGRNLPKTDMMTKTANGVHFYFQSPQQLIRPRVKVSIKGVKADVRAGTSYVVGPGSLHPTGVSYERIGDWNLVEVPTFEPSWIDVPAAHRIATVKHVTNVRAYLAKIESVQGQNGSAGLVRAAAVCRDSGLSESQATIELLHWNRGATVAPPWSEEELARAISRIYAKGESNAYGQTVRAR